MPTTDHRYLFNQMLTSVVIAAPDLTILHTNVASEPIFSQSVKRLIGQKLDELIMHTSPPWQKLFLPLKTGHQLSICDVCWHINQSEQAVDLQIGPILFDGEPALMMEIRLMTQQKKISESHRQQLNYTASKHLIRNLAHEIKNPLGGIRGAAQLLDRISPIKSTKEFTQLIIEQVDRLKELVDALLGPQTVTHKSQENIHTIIEKVLTLVSLEHDNSVCIEKNYDPSIPTLLIEKNSIEQALINIIRNAYQAINSQSISLARKKPPKIIIKTRTAHQVSIQNTIHKLALKIEVIDNGPGVNEDIIDSIFYPMISGRTDGTGLGLAIAQQAVAEHKGKIEVANKNNLTCFSIFLPFSSD